MERVGRGIDQEVRTGGRVGEHGGGRVDVGRGGQVETGGWAGAERGLS